MRSVKVVAWWLGELMVEQFIVLMIKDSQRLGDL